MAKKHEGDNSFSEKVKKSKSAYIASTTLSDRTIEKIIWCFSINCTIGEAAKKVGVSNKTTKFHYDLLVKRLCNIGHYQSYFLFKEMFEITNPELLEGMVEYCELMLRRHRGLSIENRIFYDNKYCTQFFYETIFSDAKGQVNSREILAKIMYQDIIKHIKITGHLNRPECNLEKSMEFLSGVTTRRVPRLLLREVRSFNKDNNFAKMPLYEFFLEFQNRNLEATARHYLMKTMN